jgi:hypothetical protein
MGFSFRISNTVTLSSVSLFLFSILYVLIAYFNSNAEIDLKYFFKLSQYILLIYFMQRLLIYARSPLPINKNLLKGYTLSVCIITLLINYDFYANLLQNFNFQNEIGRHRGSFIFLPFLIYLTQVKSTLKFYILVILITLIGFSISGTRSSSAGFLITSVFMRHLGSLYFLIFLFFQSVAAQVLVYLSTQLTVGSLNVRGNTAAYIYQNLNILGHGFTTGSNFKWYFQPADVGVLGSSFELGLLLVSFKFLMFLVLIRRSYKTMPADISVVLTSILFCYGMSVDFVILWFNFMYLHWIRRSA